MESPRNTFAFSSWLFLRLLALVHLAAFASFWTQLESLIGPRGLLPATRYFTAVHEQLGSAAYLELPSLCWWLGTGTFLHVLCGVGVAVSLLLFAGVAPALSLAVLWAAYLSLNAAGQIFFNFQWDSLLLEATLLAIFVAPWSWLPLWRTHEPPRAARWLLAWLLFRLMFLAGVVKLASGDPTWRDLTALTFHFETQPLPTPLGWYAHQLPLWWHRASCAVMFVIELIVPFFLFGPRQLRHVGAWILAAFMAAVALTGNYTFFNFLTIALCLLCLDDAAWRSVLPPRTRRVEAGASPEPKLARVRGCPAVVVGAFAAFAVPYTLVQTGASFSDAAPDAFYSITRIVAPFRSLNNYGLFAMMTRPRIELIFEGSDDQTEWREYAFPHKPGALAKAPTWVAPHQPRLDWHLWFAALGDRSQNPWVMSLCEHLLRGTPEVLALVSVNPFPQHPPRYVRVVRYEYHFTDRATRATTGDWWHRTQIGLYVPPASLR